MPELIFWDVDTQVDFMRSDGKLYVDGAEEIIPQLARLSDFAHDHGLRILASADDHELSHEEISDDPDFENTFPPHCLRGSEGQKRIPETRLRDPLVIEPEKVDRETLADRLARHQGEILLHKHRFDVFTNENAETVVELLDPERIVMYGVALDVCNRYAINGLLERRPDTGIALVTDATRAIHSEKRETLLEDWSNRGVEMVTTEQILSRLESELMARGEAE